MRDRPDHPNRARIWRRDAGDDFASAQGLTYDHERRALLLRAQRTLAGFPADHGAALTHLAAAPRATRDAFATFARTADGGRRVLVGGACAQTGGAAHLGRPGLAPEQLFPGAVGDPWTAELTLSSAAERVRDLAWGADGMLTLCLTGGALPRVLRIDRRRRARPETLSAPGFAADRVAAHPAAELGPQRAWLLDTVSRKLGLVVGSALPERGLPRNDAEIGRLVRENADPTRLHVLDTVTLTAGTIIDLAVDAADSDPAGDALVLIWPPSGDAVVQRVTAAGVVSPPVVLRDCVAPIALAARRDGGLLVLGLGSDEAVGFTPQAGEMTCLPDGQRFPIPDWDGAPFVRDAAGAVHIGTGCIDDGVAHPIAAPVFADLLRAATYAPQIVAPLLRCALPLHAGTRVRAIDAGRADATWHRLLVEADLARGTAITVLACASDDAAPPALDAIALPAGAASEPALPIWHAHLVLPPEVSHTALADGLPALHAAGLPRAPRAAWRAAGPVPLHEGALTSPRRPGRSGTFEVLLQRSDRVVRTLTGRYLHLHVVLHGDGARSPLLAGVQIEGPRLSWPEQHLPQHWRETRFGPDADVRGPASGPDFLSRLLANAEGLLTTIEARLAEADLLHDPRSAPREYLAWLAGWLGISLDQGLSEARQRACLAATMRIFRRRGTLSGLALALDTASGGAVSRGSVVIVEDFRLRRTLATILGADLGDEADPLLGGRDAAARGSRAIAPTGTSIVGDTLFLGDDAVAMRSELLALMLADGLSASERDSVRAFYDRLAQRVTVLVSDALPDDDLRLLRSVIERETPAHLARRVVVASKGLLVGLRSLVEIDTFLSNPEPRRPVTVETTTLGIGHDSFVLDLPALDARLDP